MIRSWRLALVIVAATLTAAALVPTKSANAAAIYDQGGKGASVTKLVTFWQFHDPPIPILFATVKVQYKLANTKALYDPGAPYEYSEMLPVVTFGTLELLNTGGVNWANGKNIQVPGVGYLDGYMVYFGVPPPGAVPPYTLTCSWIPWAHQCWRGVPDWLISPLFYLRVDWTTSSSIPWALYSNGSGMIQYGWWY